MGPLIFELRSEDPQSPRMARLPYGPALLLLAHFVYLSCYEKFIIPIRGILRRAGTTRLNPAFRRVFIDFRIFFFKEYLLPAQKKDMYLCFNQVL